MVEIEEMKQETGKKKKERKWKKKMRCTTVETCVWGCIFVETNTTRKEMLGPRTVGVDATVGLRTGSAVHCSDHSRDHF